MSGSTSRRIAGIISLTINGDTWDVVGDWEYSPVTVTRETMKGQSRVEGYSEMPNQAYMSGRMRDRSDATVYSLNGMTDATLVAQLANGKTVYGSSMWQTGEIGVNTQDGVFTIRFESDSVVEAPY
jgi:hypothetical protein